MGKGVKVDLNFYNMYALLPRQEWEVCGINLATGVMLKCSSV